jgi:4-hydroxybenzoate polyprenyltransferase
VVKPTETARHQPGQPEPVAPAPRRLRPHRDGWVRFALPAASPVAALRALPPQIRALRPLQWTKNGLVLAALVFDRQIFEPDKLVRSIAAVLIFCAISSAIYVINDLRDVAQDRLHPVKRRRPIASGELPVLHAWVLAGLLLVVGLLGAVIVRPAFALVIAGYIALMVAYSHGLKRLVIVDVFAIAAGFVLRAAGGAVAISVPISPWLYVCTMLLALFLGFGKRRHELAVLQEHASAHRANLDSYSLPLLDQIIAVVASATVMSYSLYTFDAPNVPDNRAMMLTIPFVVYAIFRYLYLIYRKQQGGSPEVLLVTDRPLLLSIVGWGLASVVILYLA